MFVTENTIRMVVTEKTKRLPRADWFRDRSQFLMEKPMKKISARNTLKGKIVNVKKGATTAHVTIDIGGQIVTAAITNESAEELKLAPGHNAYAVIKAS